MLRSIALMVVAGVALAVAACGGTSVTQTGPPPTTPDANASPGQAVFNAQNCSQCHALGGVGKGMDLSKVGAKHDKVWIADHIRDAKKHNPMSRMRPYPEDKLSANDLDTLAEFLAGLK